MQLAPAILMGLALNFQKIQLDADYTAEGIAAGDFNRDGQMDIVAGAWWYAGPDFQKRHAIFPAQPFDPRGYSTTVQPCHVFDFNGDGWPDVAYIVREGKEWNAVWCENPAGKDAPWRRHPVLTGSWCENPIWADVTRAGRPALLTFHDGRPGYATFDPAKPDTPWKFHPVSATLVKNGPAHGIGCGDIAGYGRNDLVTSSGWYEQPEQADAPWRFNPYKFAEAGAQMFVADADGDGLNDVITVWHCHRYGLVWHRQLRNAAGEISWELHEILPREPDLKSDALRISQMHALAVADLNGDGLPDLVTGKRYWAHGPTGDVEADQPAVLYWFELRRGPDGVEFAPHLIDDCSGVGTQVTVADVNGDGRPDILTSNKKGTHIFPNKLGD